MTEADSRSLVRLGLWVVLGSAVIGAGLWLTAPVPQRRDLEPRRPLVTVRELARESHRLRLQAHGRAQPLTRIDLVPEVTGAVVEVHAAFMPGGRVAQGTPIVRIDAREYVAAAAIAAADLRIAQEELALELGRQRAALAEWRQFGARGSDLSEQERDLATRGPQRRMREAAVERARASLAQARLNVERCTIRLPHDVVIESVAAAPGSLARPGLSLGSAYPLQALWVRATLPTDQLRWVDVGAGASDAPEARVFPSGQTEPIRGVVRELFPQVEERGSLGQVLVEVPFHTGSDGVWPVRAGELVRVELAGRLLRDVFVLPRAALHGEGEVWIVGEDGTLEIRRVESVFAARDVVIVREGLSDGERLVTSQLSQPVAGMQVRIQSQGGAS